LKKLDQKRYRPFRIIKKIGQGAFQLKLPEGWIIHDVFNEDLLTRYRESYYQGQHIEPAPLPKLLMKKRNTKLKKYRSIRNEEKKHNIWCIGRAMEMNTINGS